MGSVVVVGANLEGLVCAWRLQRAGHDVEVLERRATADGVLQAERRDGFAIDRGPAVGYESDRNLQQVVSALGLKPNWVSLPESVSKTVRGAELVRLPNRLASWKDAALLRGFSHRSRAGALTLYAELRRHRSRLDRFAPERAVALEGESLLAAFARSAGDAIVEAWLEPLIAYESGCDPAALSRAGGLLWLREFSERRGPQTFPGGLKFIAQALAERVPVRLGCEVERVETQSDGARVVYRTRKRTGRVVADAAVVAVRGPRVAAMCPKLSPEERGFFSSLRYAPGLSVHLMLERRLPTLRVDTVCFPSGSNSPLAGLRFEQDLPDRAPTGAGLVHVRARPARIPAFADDADAVRWALEALARTPVGRLRARSGVVHRSDHAAPVVGPGHLARVARFVRRIERSPRTVFAGDWMGGSCEAAVTRGMRAANETVRTLDGEI
jgi:protoporphyrinogen oxidase